MSENKNAVEIVEHAALNFASNVQLVVKLTIHMHRLHGEYTFKRQIQSAHIIFYFYSVSLRAFCIEEKKKKR